MKRASCGCGDGGGGDGEEARREMWWPADGFGGTIRD